MKTPPVSGFLFGPSLKSQVKNVLNHLGLLFSETQIAALRNQLMMGLGTPGPLNAIDASQVLSNPSNDENVLQ